MTNYVLTTKANLQDKQVYDKVIAIISSRGQPLEPQVSKHRGHYELSWRCEHPDTWYNMSMPHRDKYEPNVPAYGPHDAVPDLISALVSAGAITIEDYQKTARVTVRA